MGLNIFGKIGNGSKSRATGLGGTLKVDQTCGSSDMIDLLWPTLKLSNVHL